MKNLPIGVSTFESIVTSGALYVDKTEAIYRLVKDNEPKRYFFSRPRRFGKSLTCSTLEAIFSGNKELFKDLWIGSSNFAWIKRPVIWFNFSKISHGNPEILLQGLHSALDTHAKKYDITLHEQTLKEKFAELIITLGKNHGQVVVLIDEYDKPMTNAIDNHELADLIRTQLRDFYGTLKDNDVDANLHFLFVTGVSKFSKVSIFSELNNLLDITIDERYAALVGYTQQEVEMYFPDHITQLAQKEHSSYNDTLIKLKTWYNGFRFSKSEITVYNPFSLHNCLSAQDFSNYWFASGTPTFLVKYIKQNPELIKQLMMLETEKITMSDLETLSLESYFENMLILFQQAGYLTFSDFNPKTRIFNLAYPNYEVRLSMTEQIFNYVAHVKAVSIATTEDHLKTALEQDDIESFCSAMKDFFTLLPHTVIIDREKFYQGAFYTITKLIGGQIDAEHATSNGFIDAVLQGNTKIYVIEFKRNKTPDKALKQIERKDYCAKFNIQSTKPVVMVGINFDYKPKSGVRLSWKIKAMPTY